MRGRCVAALAIDMSFSHRAAHARLESIRDALPYYLCTLSLFFASLCFELAFLLLFLLLDEHLLRLPDSHSRSGPPPPAEEALPKDDRPSESRHPRILVLFGYVHEIKGGREDGKDDSAYAECGCSAVRAPGSTAVEHESPNDEGYCEEEGEGSVAYVFGVFCDNLNVLSSDEREELHHGGYDSKGP